MRIDAYNQPMPTREKRQKREIVQEVFTVTWKKVYRDNNEIEERPTEYYINLPAAVDEVVAAGYVYKYGRMPGQPMQDVYFGGYVDEEDSPLASILIDVDPFRKYVLYAFVESIQIQQ